MTMYDKLIKRLRECTAEMNGEKTLWHQAADAIEKLQQITTHYEEESKGWWLAACDAKEERERLKEQIPKWIPVTERLPEKDQEVLIFLFGEDPYIAWHNGEYWSTEDFRLDEPDDWQPNYWFPLPQPPKDGEE